MILKYDTIVIGGGAAGLCAAIASSETGKNVLLLEKSDRIGRKIAASGNGRCNLMNTLKPVYYGDPSFATAVLQECTPEDVTLFLNYYGLFLTEEKEGRVYPATFHSSSVIAILQSALKINHAEIMLRSAVAKVQKEGEFFHIYTEGKQIFESSKVIVCCGGAAQPKLGGSNDGYSILQSFGHKTAPVFPALVPVITDTKSISGLSGTRAHCTVSLFSGNQLLKREKGEILFTDYGLSGICIMQCSRWVHQQKTHFEIDFMSETFRNEEAAVSEMKRRRAMYSGFSPVSLLEGIMLPKISYAVMKQAGILLKGETAGSLSDHALMRIVQTAYHYRVDVLQTKGLEYAQVTAGGIMCCDFCPATMESNLASGLYAAGEVLNVDGACGGFNLMFAFASGLIAGGYRKNRGFASEDQV